MLADSAQPHTAYAHRYLQELMGVLSKVLESQADSIARAAQAMAQAIGQGGVVHAFGTGHSHLLAEELYYRAGGLVDVNPILFDGLMLHRDPVLSTQLERLKGLAATIVETQDVSPRDIALIASNSGANAVSCEMAQEMRNRGLTVIAVTSIHHATSREARGGGGPRLHEIADIVIDNGGVVGDALIEVQGFAQKVAPTSTATGAAIINALVAQTVANLVAAGHTPRIYSSSNTEGGDAANAEHHKIPRFEVRQS